MATTTIHCYVNLTNGSAIVTLTPGNTANNGISLAAPNVIEDMQLVLMSPIDATRFVKGSLSTTTLEMQEAWQGSTVTNVEARVATSGSAVATLTKDVRDLINQKEFAAADFLVSAQTAHDKAAEALISAQAAADDRHQTGLDRLQTGEDRTATGLDRLQTGGDRTATGLDRAAVADDRVAAQIFASLAQATNPDSPIRINPRRITADFTVASAYNAQSTGPITIADGVTVTVSDNATWSIS